MIIIITIIIIIIIAINIIECASYYKCDIGALQSQ